MANRAISGARVQVMLDSKEIAWGVGASISENRNLVAIDVLNNPWTQDFELTGITVAGSISMVYIGGKSMGEVAQYPNSQVKEDQISFKKATLVFYDSISEKVLARAFGVAFGSRDFSITRDSVIMNNVSFRALRFETVAVDQNDIV